VAVDVAARHRQRIRGQVAGVHRGLRPGHRREHRQTAVARAQVEHARGLARQPRIERAVGQRLGDQRTRHDGALVHMEGHALQPRLAGEVGRRAARRDPLAHEDIDRRLLRRVQRPIGHTVEIVQRAAEAPQHEPRGLVERVGRAMPKANARLGQAGAGALDRFQHGHVSRASRVRR
jgi:hypothetical protein